jgi:hypothetical protein
MKREAGTAEIASPLAWIDPMKAIHQALGRHQHCVRSQRFDADQFRQEPTNSVNAAIT